MVFSLCRLALFFIDNFSQFFYSLFNVHEGHVTVFSKFFGVSLPACHFYHKAGCGLLWKVSSAHCVMEYQSTENHGLSVMESIMENIYVPKSLRGDIHRIQGSEILVQFKVDFPPLRNSPRWNIIARWYHLNLRGDYHSQLIYHVIDAII